ncbi:hypothetical protein GCM10007901_40350 [Dyella acidisoli]|uniref:Uncharacterized protein n=1 Tax=Dyella acidisoli TaxID=1867834 RepID=A0ABQ5XUR4_9GAMM|nr:hypothetical protein GCM10007901_40350 [Dyella acidisoli]
MNVASEPLIDLSAEDSGDQRAARHSAAALFCRGVTPRDGAYFVRRSGILGGQEEVRACIRRHIALLGTLERERAVAGTAYIAK